MLKSIVQRFFPWVIVMARFVKHTLPELLHAYSLIITGKGPGIILGFDGGIGDHLLCSTVAYELKKRKGIRIWLQSPYPELFCNNPSIDWVFKRNIFQRNIVKLNYYRHDPVEKKRSHS